MTPGFVDIHTHYDGQATWDGRMQPSSWHGVTTVVMGNCGVGFAPCREDDHDKLVRLMEGVEDIPFPVLTQGLPWNWRSYPDYLDALGARSFDVDIGSQLPHAALRVFVMGQRGADREPATADDIARMRQLAKEAMEAGAIGFGTSRTLNHRTSDGEPIATLTASEEELTAIAMGMAEAGRGVLQVVSDFADPEAEFAMLRRIVEASGRPLSFTLAQGGASPKSYQILLKALEDAVAAGLPMKAQVAARPVGVLLGLELTVNPFTKHPAYKAVAALPLAERVERLSDPALRAELATAPRENGAFGLGNRWDHMYLLDAEQPDYEPIAEDTVAARAARMGSTPETCRARSHADRRRSRHPLCALPQLRRGFAGRGSRDDRPPRHRAGPVRRWRACRHDLRRQLPDLDADALDPRPHTRPQDRAARRDQDADP